MNAEVKTMAFNKWVGVSIIALIVVSAVLTATTLAVLSANKTVPYNGSIATVNLAAYSDSACTIPVTSLNAGTLSPGGTSTQTIYILNTGTVSETLTMTVNNWSPANANNYLTLTWNRQNTVLSAGQSTPATLTLTAASNTGSLTTFSCDVTLTGTQ